MKPSAFAVDARIMAPGIGDESGTAIGRVVTSPKARGGGLGHTLIRAPQYAIAVAINWWFYSRRGCERPS